MKKRITAERTDYYCFNSNDNLKAYYSNNSAEGQYAYYNYDDAGERTYKVQLSELTSRTNAFESKILEIDKIMYYPNGYINFDESGNYTKHYYADAQRVASQIGGGYENDISAGIVDTTHLLAIMKDELGILAVYHMEQNKD
jgi:hypothetical protein